MTEKRTTGSPEATPNERRSAASKRDWADPAIRQRRITGLNDYWIANTRRERGQITKNYWAKASPEAHRERSQVIKAALANPQVRQKISAASKDRIKTPVVRQRMSAASKRNWADPAIRQRRIAGLRRNWADPNVHQQRSQINKNYWAKAGPEAHRERSEAVKAALADPQVRQRISKGSKLAWADPEAYRRRSDGIRSRTAEQKQRLAEAERLKNVEGLDLKTGLRISLTAHKTFSGKTPYAVAPDVCPDSSDPSNALKQILWRFPNVFEDEKQRVARLDDDQRQRKAKELEARLHRELAKPAKKNL